MSTPTSDPRRSQTPKAFRRRFPLQHVVDNNLATSQVTGRLWGRVLHSGGRTIDRNTPIDRNTRDHNTPVNRNTPDRSMPNRSMPNRNTPEFNTPNRRLRSEHQSGKQQDSSLRDQLSRMEKTMACHTQLLSAVDARFDSLRDEVADANARGKFHTYNILSLKKEGEGRNQQIQKMHEDERVWRDTMQQDQHRLLEAFQDQDRELRAGCEYLRKRGDHTLDAVMANREQFTAGLLMLNTLADTQAQLGAGFLDLQQGNQHTYNAVMDTRSRVITSSEDMQERISYVNGSVNAIRHQNESIQNAIVDARYQAIATSEDMQQRIGYVNGSVNAMRHQNEHAYNAIIDTRSQVIASSQNMQELISYISESVNDIRYRVQAIFEQSQAMPYLQLGALQKHMDASQSAEAQPETFQVMKLMKILQEDITALLSETRDGPSTHDLWERNDLKTPRKLVEDLQSTQKHLHDKIKQLSERYDELMKQLSRFSGHLASPSQVWDDVQEQRVQKLHQNIAAAQARFDELRCQYESMSGDLREQRSARAQAEKEGGDLKQRIALFEAELLDLQKQKEADGKMASNRCEKLSTDLIKLYAELQHKEAQLVRLNKKYEALQGRLDSTEQELQGAVGNIQTGTRKFVPEGFS